MKAILHPEVALEFSSRLTIVTPFLEPTVFAALKNAVSENFSGERVHIPAHKRGETVSYDNVRLLYPLAWDVYQAMELVDTVSRIVREDVQTTPTRDQSSCSIIAYNREGDRIGWHYDHNFYSGRHFTAILSLMNAGREPGTLSS